MLTQVSWFHINSSVVLGFIVDVFSFCFKMYKNTKETFATYSTPITSSKHAFLFNAFELWGRIPSRNSVF